MSSRPENVEPKIDSNSAAMIEAGADCVLCPEEIWRPKITTKAVQEPALI